MVVIPLLLPLSRVSRSTCLTQHVLVWWDFFKNSIIFGKLRHIWVTNIPTGHSYFASVLHWNAGRIKSSIWEVVIYSPYICWGNGYNWPAFHTNDWHTKFSKAVKSTGTNFFEVPLEPATPSKLQNHSVVDDADKLYKGGGFKDVTLPTGQILEDHHLLHQWNP